MQPIKKILLASFILFTCFSTQAKLVSAHAADVAYLDLFLYQTPAGNPLQTNTIHGILSVSWVQMSWLAKDYLNSELPASQQKIPQDAYVPYFSNNLIIKNDSDPCTITYGNIPKTSDSDIVFGKGLPIPFDAVCTQQVHKISVTSTLFLEQFPLHSTILSVMVGKGEKQTDTVLTQNYQTFIFTPTKPQPTPKTPAARMTKVSKQTASLPTLAQATNTFASLFMKQGKTSLPLAILFVFFLGMLHTLEAGHSKTILASYVLNKRVSLKRALSFAGVFTFTHLADILLLGIFFLITNSFIDLYSKLSALNIVALYVLLFISIYMILRSTGEFVKHNVQHIHATAHSHDKQKHSHNQAHSHEHDHNHDHTHPWEAHPHDLKKQLLMAFLIGLSPCIFGWSIFMVIISMKQVWTVIPILFSFGLGIFSALTLVVLIMTKIKIKFADKYQWVGELSPVVSYILLAIFALASLWR